MRVPLVRLLEKPDRTQAQSLTALLRDEKQLQRLPYQACSREGGMLSKVLSLT